jgi:hypothetical protein
MRSQSFGDLKTLAAKEDAEAEEEVHEEEAGESAVASPLPAPLARAPLPPLGLSRFSRTPSPAVSASPAAASFPVDLSAFAHDSKRQRLA